MAKTTIRGGQQVRDETLLVDDFKDFSPEAATGLDLTVRAGRIHNDNVVTDKNDQTVALTDDTTNYVEIDASGVASANTSSFTSGSIPIAEVVTASGAISTVTDKRSWFRTGGGSGGLTQAQALVRISLRG